MPASAPDFRRPARYYLLVLARSCPSLRKNSLLVAHDQDRIFRPSSDVLVVADNGTICEPHKLYAIDDRHIEWLEAYFAGE